MQSDTEGLAAVRAVVGGFGHSLGLQQKAGRGRGSSAGPRASPHASPPTTFCVTLGMCFSFPEPQFTHLCTRELGLMLSKGPPD